MGSGASSLPRLRKALLIKAYNVRNPEETLDEQFRKFTFRKPDNRLHILVSDIRKCLAIEPGEYLWIEDLFASSNDNKLKPDINFNDFIKFLESGKMPDTLGSTLPPHHKSSKINKPCKPNDIDVPRSDDGATSGENRPPFPPHLSRSVSTDHHISAALDVDASSEEPEVMHINLSTLITGSSLPESIKLHSLNGVTNTVKSVASDDEAEEMPFTVIVHPQKGGSSLVDTSEPKALWRKREVVTQERTVHYTTMDSEGALQELVEKETTQTEILHMECRETGEFAHRETTKYEQIETFNEDVVAEVHGAEEYVHLKSAEDEFHYMESTMPESKRPGGTSSAESGGQPQSAEGEGGVHGEEGRPLTAEEEAEYEERYAAFLAAEERRMEGGADELPDDTPLEDYGFDTQHFAAHSPGPAPRTPKYKLDPEYADEQPEESDQQHPRSCGVKDQLFGDKVQLDDSYGASLPHNSDSKEGESKESQYQINCALKKDSVSELEPFSVAATGEEKECNLVRCCSYESLHEID